MIYEFKTSLTVSGGSATTVTLSVIHGLLRNVYVKANTSTTVFRAQLLDEDGLNRLDYGFATGVINDNTIQYPIVNKYTFNILNANPTNETFVIRLGVEE